MGRVELISPFQLQTALVEDPDADLSPSRGTSQSDQTSRKTIGGK